MSNNQSHSTRPFDEPPDSERPRRGSNESIQINQTGTPPPGMRPVYRPQHPQQQHPHQQYGQPPPGQQFRPIMRPVPRGMHPGMQYRPGPGRPVFARPVYPGQQYPQRPVFVYQQRPPQQYLVRPGQPRPLRPGQFAPRPGQFDPRGPPGQPMQQLPPGVMQQRPPGMQQRPIQYHNNQQLPERRNSTSSSFVAPPRRGVPMAVRPGQPHPHPHHLQQQFSPQQIQQQRIHQQQLHQQQMHHRPRPTRNPSITSDPISYPGQPLMKRSSFESFDDSFTPNNSNNHRGGPPNNHHHPPQNHHQRRPTLTTIKQHLDELVDQGQSLFSKHLYDDAITKWVEALDLSVESQDLFSEAKILSNLGCVLRIQGKHVQSLEYFDLSFDRSSRYVIESQKEQQGTASPWIYLILQIVDIDESKYPVSSSEDLRAAGGGAGLRRSASLRSTSSISSTGATTILGAGDPAFGPPVVVALMDLASNIGNIHFCMGNFEESITWHDNCLKLSEAVLEEFPLPQGHETPLQKTSTSSLNSRSTGTKNKKTPAMKHVVMLSYLHRSTLLAQIRSYTHLSMCFLSRGDDEESLYYSNRAKSLVTYFSDQSKATRAPCRTSSISRTTIVVDQTRLYDATVCGNAGTIAYTMGSVPKSLELHEHAAKLFNEIGDASALAKERGNLGCIWLEIGKGLNSLHWIDTIETAAEGTHSYEDVETIVFDACSPFWGPPRIGDAEDKEGGEVVCAGSKLVEKAIIMVIGMMEKSKRLDDWMGVMTSCLNLGMCEALLISVAVCYTVSQQPFIALFYLTRMLHLDDGSDLEGVLCIPPYFETQVMFILCQAFYLLARMEPSTEGLLFESEDVDSPKHPEAVNSLLRALGVDWIDVGVGVSGEDLSKLLCECLERIQAPQSPRNSMSLPKPLLESDNRLLDSVKRRVLVTKTTIGKINWLLGAGSYNCTDEYQAKLEEGPVEMREIKCVEGEGWLREASEFLGSVVGFEIGVGFIDGMVQLARMDETGLFSVGPVPGVFELAADIVEYALFLSRSDKAFDVIGTLGIESGEEIEEIRKVLVGAARQYMLGNLEFCWACVGRTLRYGGGDAGGGLVPVSAEGAGAKFLESSWENGVLVFPCEHRRE